MLIECVIANYASPQQGVDIGRLLDAYARDPMGGGEALDPEVLAALPAALAEIDGAFTVLAFVDGEAVGLVNCFQGFSTFKCRPLINIHDLVVLPAWRGLGLSQRMLQEVENVAHQRGCCKLTLEVLEGNTVARRAYEQFGFDGYELDPQTGKALFWQKLLA